MKMRGSRFGRTMWLALGAMSLLVVQATAQRPKGEWVAGDFHQHTTYSDGANSFKTVMFKNDQFGLDWWANSEHGGRFSTDARGPLTIDGPFNVNGGYGWTNTTYYPVNPIIPMGLGLTSMWRWQSLRDYSFEDLLEARATYGKTILQSFEWNVPGHEHCSLGLFEGQFSALPSADALAQFEYLFDANDTDAAGGAAQGWTGKNTVNDHAKAIEALRWLQANYPDTSYAVFAHPERKGVGDRTYVGSGSRGYNISDFRDFNNAAPDVAVGFESMPGHQKEPGRGGYGSAAIGGGTFGGVGAYAAKVGGLWDAMLGEGRHFWLFASSDFHNTDGDFWPGEYQKTYTFVADRQDPKAIKAGLRSGNTFIVSGDLINALDFRAQYSSAKAAMGETLQVIPKNGTGHSVKMTIRFKSPASNYNGDPVIVDHIDLIAGDVTGPVAPSSPSYNSPVNASTEVIKTFTQADWTLDEDGYFVAQFFLRPDRDMYFRLRGTNLAPNTPNETDAAGNPLADTLVGANTPAKAWADLWFYSNPIFVRLVR